VTKEKRKVIWVPPCGAVSQNKLAGMVRGTRGAPGGAEPGTGDRTGGVLQDPPNILHSKMSVILMTIFSATWTPGESTSRQRYR